ncbi:MAG: FIST N-terminal domain-containing protein [Verrucomicrobiota bacterium]
MKTSQQIFSAADAAIELGPVTRPEQALLLAFGPEALLTDGGWLARVREAFPGVSLVGCTTAGEISHEGAQDGVLTLTLAEFQSTELRVATEEIPSMGESRVVGGRLASQLLAPGDLAAAFVLSDGLEANGSELVEGLRQEIGPATPLSGGLAGDGPRFENTLLLHNGEVLAKHVLGIGFYGEKVRVSASCFSGWTPFGTFRKVTRSRANIVEEIDEKPALEVYSSYLGPEAEELPSSGLLYPLELRLPGAEEDGLIRTLLAVDREQGSLTFAGDVPLGAEVRLMNASYSQLVDGATTAAQGLSGSPDLAILISCVGRKLLMGNYTDLEVSAVAEALPGTSVFTGFHSYGEVGPSKISGKCELHNQTMTITAFGEDA